MEEKEAEELIQFVKEHPQTRAERAERACSLAKLLLCLSLNLQTKQEKKDLEKLAKLMDDRVGKVFTTEMTDQCFRSSSTRRTANQLTHLLKVYGIPKYLPIADQLKLWVFRIFGRFFSFLFVPLAQKDLRKQLTKVILPDEKNLLQQHFKSVKARGIRLNINHLGEAILGEEEAHRRLRLYLEDLANPLIEYISIKISTIFSQINPIDFETTLEQLAEKLSLLYRAAKQNPYTDPQGNTRHKFVNLDMEEYKDLDFTVELFQRVLSKDEFSDLEGGIVLQSYVPDSFAAQQKLTEWALKRVEKGGAPIKIRLVKGANLEMERVESSLRVWELPTYSNKTEADANFKKMMEYGLQNNHAHAVRIGIGSHNLFDISYALLLRAEQSVEPFVTFEMLAGMAEPMQRAVQLVSGGMLLYCPEAKADAFQNAVAYLIRRLDENTGPNNFLRHLFNLTPQSPAFEKQKELFLKSCEAIDTVSPQRKRGQNRLQPPLVMDEKAPFQNEPDTDFSLEENRAWASRIYSQYLDKTYDQIPLVIGGETREGEVAEGFDPSRPGKALYTYTLADTKSAEEAILKAKGIESVDERSHYLQRVAQKLREKRGELIGVMIGDGAKTFTEADVEISEAIDFCEYYRKNFQKIRTFTEVGWRPKGTILVAPPWNFPLSIPVGGIAAALMGGNGVLFKPAPETILIGWSIACCFWESGVSKEALQFIACADDPVGSYIVKHPKLDGVILTGATATAKQLLKLNPSLDLMAETGGKNALIATALSDRDLVARDAVHSAFLHAGQKCSACSLLIIEKELYYNDAFLQQLKDAAQSLPVGSAWDPKTQIPPLIRRPGPDLRHAFLTLDRGESWLLEPKAHKENPALYSPGIKLGVREGTFSHQTEFFGPILSVMKAKNLNHAIKLANSTPYGLTSGLHSLDEREQEVWKKHIVAGNLYINRGITGAIIRRQPFGGCKASGFGSGAKAGGPNYVIELCQPEQLSLPQTKGHSFDKLLSLFPLSAEEKTLLNTSLSSYEAFAPILKKPLDPSSLIGEDNLFYHVSREEITLRITPQDKVVDVLRVIGAAKACHTPLHISSADKRFDPLKNLESITYTLEEKTLFLIQVERGAFSRVRLLSSPSDPLKLAAAKSATYLIKAPVLATGRFELLHYLREVSLSHDYHRYGNLGKRGPKI